MLGCTRVGVWLHTSLQRPASSQGRLLLLEQCPVIVFGHLHDVLWAHAEAVILCPEGADLLSCQSMTMHPKELPTHPVSFSCLEGRGGMEGELKSPLRDLLQQGARLNLLQLELL